MAAQNDLPRADSHPSASDPWTFRWLLLILCCGLCVRIFLLLSRPEDLRSDTDAYVALATSLLENGGLCQPDSDVPTAYRPPLYPLLLAALMWTGLTSAVAAGVINLVAGGVQIVATWGIGRLVGLRSLWLSCATVISAADPLLLRYTTQPMTEVVSAALLSLALVFVLSSLTGIRSETGDYGCAVWAGLFFGLAGLCRPIALVTCACFSVFLFARCRPLRSLVAFRQDWTPVQRAVLPAVVAGLVLAPWVVRNFLQLGSFIPATTHGGYTLLLGNNQTFYREVVLMEGQPVWQGASLKDWQTGLRHRLNSENIDLSSETAVDQWYYQQARQAIRANPSAFLQACILRWKRFWAVLPASDTVAVPGGIKIGVGLWYSAMWLGLLGSLFRLGGIRLPVQILWLAVLSFLLMHTFYWTNARMRTPLTSVFAVLAVVGWQFWTELFQRFFGTAHAAENET